MLVLLRNYRRSFWPSAPQNSLTRSNDVSVNLYSPGPIAPTRGDNNSTSGQHNLEIDDEWTEVNGIRKRRQRQCEVCTIRKTVRTKLRQGHYQNNGLTCNEIWRQLWRNETERRQPRCGRGIQMGARKETFQHRRSGRRRNASNGINHSGEDREATSDTVVEKCADGCNDEEDDAGYEEGDDKEMPTRAEEVSDGSEGGSGEEAGDDAAL
ncbi:Hypothetical protein PHPALM_9309 [Phytophthora palmivora]|uniref:Uncharacterized protein n=1 Tax=Phytophthora palmivora TaxID=4796 RepID=A0A2P4Y7L8_9STRA|nr:Hypothetical protein PHPALM_9309 [Phytophthora palmivora]